MSRINEDQKEFLISFMENNHKFLLSKHPTANGKTSKELKWNELAIKLNELGPQKTADKWKKVNLQ